MTVLGKHAVITLDGDDISTYTNSIEFNYSVDSHDVTTFGPGNGHEFSTGLEVTTVSLAGFYEQVSASGSPANIIPALTGLTVELVYRPEGTGSGKSQRTCDVQLTTYAESVPSQEMISWSAEFQVTGEVDFTDQT